MNVVNRAFFNPTLEVAAQPGFWTEAWFVALLKQALVGLLLLFLALGLLRPLYRNLSKAGAMVEERNNMALAQIARTSSDQASTPLLGASSPAVAGGYEGKVDSVRSLVAEDPGRVAQVVKHWVSSDE